MAANVTTWNILSALSTMRLTDTITSMLSSAQSAISFDMAMQFAWYFYVNYLVFSIVLCIVYAGLRAKNEDACGRCACAIMSFPLSVIPYVYVKQGSGVVFGYRIYHSSTNANVNFQVASTDDDTPIIR
jgi:hypothetical protein